MAPAEWQVKLSGRFQPIDKDASVHAAIEDAFQRGVGEAEARRPVAKCGGRIVRRGEAPFGRVVCPVCPRRSLSGLRGEAPATRWSGFGGLVGAADGCNSVDGGGGGRYGRVRAVFGNTCGDA